MKAKEEYWEQLFKSYKRSGLSQEAFCGEQGISIPKFKYQWRKKFDSKSNQTNVQNSPDNFSPFEPILIRIRFIRSLEQIKRLLSAFLIRYAVR